jgi:DNA-directed RNA polymerase specialized sigma24 family protein
VTVNDDFVAGRFQAHRNRLRAMAYRMLDSVTEADDAVQPWMRPSRANTNNVVNLTGSLTTVIGRVCMNGLQARLSDRQEAGDLSLAAPTIGQGEGTGSGQQALLADSVGLALLFVIGTLPSAQRLAFVLHDIFAVPYDQIADSWSAPAAKRQPTSRARRRIPGDGRHPGRGCKPTSASRRARSSPPPAAANPTRWSLFSTTTSCSQQTALPRQWDSPAMFVAQKALPTSFSGRAAI